MHNRALGSTCSIPSRLWDLSATASFQFFRPRRAGGPKTRVIFIDFLVVVGNSGGKKTTKKKQCFFLGGGTKHDQMIQNAYNSMQPPLSFVRPVVGMWKLGSLWRKGHRGKYLTFESCTLPTFRPPWVFISDIFSIRLWLSSLFFGTYYREVRRPSTTYTLHSPPVFWTQSLCFQYIRSTLFCPGLSAKSGNRPKSAFATSTREGKGPTEIVSCGASAIHRKSPPSGNTLNSLHRNNPPQVLTDLGTF